MPATDNQQISHFTDPVPRFSLSALPVRPACLMDLTHLSSFYLSFVSWFTQGYVFLCTHKQHRILTFFSDRLMCLMHKPCPFESVSLMRAGNYFLRRLRKSKTETEKSLCSLPRATASDTWEEAIMLIERCTWNSASTLMHQRSNAFLKLDAACSFFLFALVNRSNTTF